MVEATSDNARGGRREANARRNRRALELHAMRLFCERGYAEVTVNEIADAALLSTRTFFRYFASKEEVVFQREREYVSHLRHLIAARPPDESPELALARALLRYAEMLQEERDVLIPRMKLLSVTPELLAKGLLLKRQVELEAADQLAQRSRQPLDLRLRTIADARVAALAAASTEWFLSGGEQPYRVLLEEAFTAVGIEY
jgi:AcrR family transcriptional regulator